MVPNDEKLTCLLSYETTLQERLVFALEEPTRPILISELQFNCDVCDVLTSLGVAKATGPDGVGPRILKTCALALYIAFHQLFSLRLTQGYNL